MAISQTRQEALNKLRITIPAEPIATFFDTLFQEFILLACRAPLLRDALALFEEHWTAANGAKVQVHANDVINLLGRTAVEWRTNILRAEASDTHASELQAQVEALEAKLANPFKENPADHLPKASGSANVAPQEHHKIRLLKLAL